MKNILHKRGQSTFEYAVIFAAIVGVVVVAVNRALRTQTCQIYQDMGNRMDRSSDNMPSQFGASPTFPAKTGNEE